MQNSRKEYSASADAGVNLMDDARSLANRDDGRVVGASQCPASDQGAATTLSGDVPSVPIIEISGLKETFAMEFCLRVPISVEHPTGRFCVDIPALVRMFPKEPEPDPRGDWSILATINELARSLSGDRGIEIIRSVAAQVEAADRGLGDAATLSLGAPA